MKQMLIAIIILIVGFAIYLYYQRAKTEKSEKIESEQRIDNLRKSFDSSDRALDEKLKQINFETAMAIEYIKQGYSKKEVERKVDSLHKIDIDSVLKSDYEKSKH